MSVLLENLYARARAGQLILKPFFYSTQFLNNAVAVATAVTQTINIQADSHFVCRYFNVTTYDSASGRTIVATTAPMLTVSFFDTGTGETIQDNAQAIQNLTGQGGGNANGMLPFILPEPWLIKAAGAVQVTVTNLTTGGLGFTYPRVDVSLCGFKVKKPGGGVPNLDV